MNELTSALVGIVIGVILEDPLTKLRDNCIGYVKKFFYKRKRIHLSSSGNFYFGSLETPWRVIDGDGEDSYQPRTIETSFSTKPLVLPEDLQKKKKAIEHAHTQKGNSPIVFNGDRYRLDSFSIKRDSTEENLDIQLQFGASDYFTFLATNMELGEKEVYEKYIGKHDWQAPIPYFANSFGISLCVITKDNFIFFVRRSSKVSSNKGTYNVSVNEGLSRTFDRKVSTQAPDIYRCALRGIIEELGINTITQSDILILSFGVDTTFAQWGMLGMVHVEETAEEILRQRTRSVKDKWETDSIDAVRFDVKDVLHYVSEHGPWAPAALACLYHCLVHEFGRQKVEHALHSFSPKHN